MENHVHPVIATCIETPQFVLNPESREHDRVVLRVVGWGEPDRFESIATHEQRVGPDILIIVPDEARVQGRPIRDDRQDEDRHRGRSDAKGSRGLVEI